jgi:hypothetical protein
MTKKEEVPLKGDLGYIARELEACPERKPSSAWLKTKGRAVSGDKEITTLSLLDRKDRKM